MHLIEDYRKNKKGDDDDDNNEEDGKSGENVTFPFDPNTENISLNDKDAMKLGGHNPLAEEEGVKEDDDGGD